MKYALCALAGFLLVPTENAAQDPNVRTEALQLLEKANGVSMSPNLPNLERTDVFRVLDTSSPVREGTFTRVAIQGVGRREETIFGDYHTINIFTDAGLSTVRTSELPPPDVETVMRLTPIYLLTFADDDVIHAIVDKAGAGAQKLRCIQFDTIRGQRIENNEICVDAAAGTLVSEKIGTRLIEYSEYFAFAGELLPAKISYSRDGVRKMEITQTLVELKDATENVLAAPPNASVRAWCKTFKRAIGQSMPQPKEGRGARNIDVAIRGIIGRDGKVHQAVVQSAERDDLGAEALVIVQQWVFAPALCNGRPNDQEATFIVHFRGR
jgi:TonB-like protein